MPRERRSGATTSDSTRASDAAIQMPAAATISSPSNPASSWRCSCHTTGKPQNVESASRSCARRNASVRSGTTLAISNTREGDDLVLLAMIGPEALAVESQRARSKADASDVFDLRFFAARVDVGQPVVGRLFIVGRERVEAAVDDDH